MTDRPSLSERGLPIGPKARLYRILHQDGLRNGTALFLPYDQGLEHGPRDFFANPASGEPRYIVKLAGSTVSPSRSGWRRSSTGTMPVRYH